jgi:Protein of unknown function (DUF3460)
MPLFWKPYKSEATQFIEGLKRQDLTLEARQRQGRQLLWDRELDRDLLASADASRVAQQPYVYQTKG